jgi:hypothetical protein
MRWVRPVACMGDTKDVFKILVEVPEVKRQVECSSHKWEQNIKMDFKGIMYECVNWIHLAQDSLGNTVLNLQVL